MADISWIYNTGTLPPTFTPTEVRVNVACGNSGWGGVGVDFRILARHNGNWIAQRWEYVWLPAYGYGWAELGMGIGDFPPGAKVDIMIEAQLHLEPEKFASPWEGLRWDDVYTIPAPSSDWIELIDSTIFVR